MRPEESARGLAQSKTWRIAGARDLSRFAAGFRGWPASPKFSARSGLKSALLRALSFCFLLSAFCSEAWAQYSIDWSTIDGGGGTSTGGVYSVSGTIGQPDAGTMSGGNYSLTGGFWALISVVQTPGLPNLTITFVGPNSVVVSWPNTGSYTLQTNNNLNTSNWLGYGGTINTVNGTNSVTVTPPTGNLFFRLKR